MAAPYPIERTLAELADSTNTVNLVGPTNTRKSAFQPIVAIATDHDSDEPGGAIEDRAIFKSSRVGEPWIKDDNVQASVIFQQEATPVAVPTNVTVLFPNWDYTTFQ